MSDDNKTTPAPEGSAQPDFKARLIAEKAELNERLDKLKAFQESEAFQKIDAVQMTLLNIQAHAMQTYSQCLLERIARL